MGLHVISRVGCGWRSIAFQKGSSCYLTPGGKAFCSKETAARLHTTPLLLRVPEGLRALQFEKQVKGTCK